jgi:hypothetical protein
VMRILFLVAPVVAFAVVRKVCLDLAESEREELRSTLQGERV